MPTLKPPDIIPHSRPSVDQTEIDAISHVLTSGQLAQGPQVRAFEEEVGQFLHLPPGVATSSGTTALHLALLGLEVGPGDEVLLPSYVCSAPLHAVHHTGAKPVFVDVDPITGNMDPADLRNRLTSKSKAIIAVHLFGLPAAMGDILATGLPVIEDCAQALGATMEGRQLGTLGEATVCSFYATKLMSTGEGGMVLSADHGRLERIRDLKDYDKKDEFAVRFNYKMTDLQGVLGRCQLKKLTTFLQQRKTLAAVYAECLASLPCTLPQALPGRIYYRYVISMDQDISALIQALADQGVEAARPIYTPLHRHLNLPGYPGADRAWETHLSLPIHPSLSPEDVERICQVLQQSIKA